MHTYFLRLISKTYFKERFHSSPYRERIKERANIAFAYMPSLKLWQLKKATADNTKLNLLPKNKKRKLSDFSTTPIRYGILAEGMQVFLTTILIAIYSFLIKFT
jgi:hypothetical protein